MEVHAGTGGALRERLTVSVGQQWTASVCVEREGGGRLVGPRRLGANQLT